MQDADATRPDERLEETEALVRPAAAGSIAVSRSSTPARRVSDRSPVDADLAQPIGRRNEQPTAPRLVTQRSYACTPAGRWCIRTLAPLVACIVALLALARLPGGVGSTSDVDTMRVDSAVSSPQVSFLTVMVTDSGHGTTLPVYVSARSLAGWSLLDLHSFVARRLGVGEEYLVLARGAPLLDAAGRASARDSSLLSWFSMDRGTLPEVGLQQARDRLRAIRLVDAQVGPGDVLTALLRPLRGDHIHTAFAIYAYGRPLSHIRDREQAGWPSEGTHVAQLYPHFGVHAGAPEWFDDGLIHVHPATSWQWFVSTEGLGASLGAFLEQIGIVVWGPHTWRYPGHKPFASMPHNSTCIDFDRKPRFAGDSNDTLSSTLSWQSHEYAMTHTCVCSNTSHVWRAYYWWHWASPTPHQVLEEGFDRLWLAHADAMLTLSFEARDGPRVYAPRDDVFDPGSGGAYPYPFAASVGTLQTLVAEGFDGREYPRPHAR